MFRDIDCRTARWQAQRVSTPNGVVAEAAGKRAQRLKQVCIAAGSVEGTASQHAFSLQVRQRKNSMHNKPKALSARSHAEHRKLTPKHDVKISAINKVYQCG